MAAYFFKCILIDFGFLGALYGREEGERKAFVFLNRVNPGRTGH
jgi:hypothetical protein